MNVNINASCLNSNTHTLPYHISREKKRFIALFYLIPIHTLPHISIPIYISCLIVLVERKKKNCHSFPLNSNIHALPHHISKKEKKVCHFFLLNFNIYISPHHISREEKKVCHFFSLNSNTHFASCLNSNIYILSYYISR